MQKTNIPSVNKNDDLGTMVLLKCYYVIEEFAPELKSLKPHIFTNKKLYTRLKNDYYTTEVLQTYKKMKEIVGEKNKENELKAEPELLLAENNGFRIKTIIKEAYYRYFNNKDVQEFIFKFLLPYNELLDYNCKVSSLKYQIKEYEMLSKEEVECHYISFILRGDNFKFICSLGKKLEKIMTSSSKNLRTLLFDSVKALGKNRNEKLFLIKTNVQFKNYESIIMKKKLLP